MLSTHKEELGGGEGGPALWLTSPFLPPDLGFLTCKIRVPAGGPSNSFCTLMVCNLACVTVPGWTWVMWAVMEKNVQTLSSGKGHLKIDHFGPLKHF